MDAAGEDAFDHWLPSLLDLGLVPPAVGVETSAGKRRTRTEFGDFAGHVPYAAGEDVRFLDWKALARSGHKVLRSFDEVRHERLELVLDLSRSMESRLVGVRRLGRLLAFLALHRLDSFELTLLGGDAGSLHFEGIEAWPRARTTLRGLEARGSDALDDLAGVLAPRPRASDRVLVSDFQPEERCGRALEHCAQLGHRLLCVFPRLPFEAGEAGASLSFGPCLLRDGETGAVLDLALTPSLVGAFLDEQRAWEGRMSRLCHENGHQFLAATLPEDATSHRTAAWLPFLAVRE